MKNSQNNSKPIQQGNHKPRPEIRDDMDSRSTRQGNYKGDISKKGDKEKKDDPAASQHKSPRNQKWSAN